MSSYSFDTGEGRLWIDPVTQADFSLSIIGGVGTPIVAFAFREANAGVNFQQVIDNLCVADAFADVFNCQALPPTGACCPAPRGAECCPGDLNGDQVVDDLDAGPFVTALLNNVYDACADMQPDLADNGADIQPFVVAALAETPCAAACFELTEDECESDGGTYQGNNTICDPETCIIPTTGACCVNSVCTDVSEEDCDSAGGLFAGLGNDCDENPCVGRCCLGANCGVQSLASCQSVGGTYGGDGTTCTPNPCTGGCSNIAQTRTLPDGASARVCGVISSVTDLVIGGNPEVASFQLQDGSGEDNQSALTVFGPQTLIVSILANAGGLGAQVELRGTVNIFNGLFELDNGTTPLELIATTGNPGAPAPFLVEPADFQDQSPTAEGLESEVVRVECVQFIELEPPFYDAGAFGRNYIVTDGTTTFTVRIAHPGLNLQFENIPIGPANLTGIFGQSDNSADPVDAGYQLLLRTTNDDEEVQPGDEDCPIPTGACCHDDICDVVTRRECIENFAGGYYGDGTNCDEGCPNYCIIISEIVDGDRTGGTPKYVEITNTGSSPYTFSAGSGIIVSNSPTAVEIDHDLSGMTILAGESYVAAGSGQNGQAQFESTYAPPGYPAGPIVANAYVDGISGNGDDAVALADGGTIIDIYGFLGSDGTGTPWQYEDSVATRNFSASTADGLFHVTDWTIT
ncbi:MAG TPA: hypothetical protein VNT79_04020, partial [Phycisphaerae bacterium]|nr:hypothetical protein [Phycisphaerae bacterium]